MRILAFTCLLAAATLSAQAPPTRTDSVKDTLHGIEITDPYRWLEDQKSPETRAWIDAQNTYTRSVLDKLPGRDALRKRLSELARVDTRSMPIYRGGRYFFSKRKADQELSVLAVRQGLDGADEVLVDPATLTADGSKSVGWQAFSRDGSLAAYWIRQGGQDEVEIKLLNVAAKKHLSDEFPRARYGSMALLNDKSGLYYSLQTGEGPRLYFHKMGAALSSDQAVYGEGLGPSWFLGVSVSRDGRYLMVSVSEGSASKFNELYIKDLTNNGPLKPVVKGIQANFGGQLVGDSMYVQTNWNAPNYRLLRIDLVKPEQGNWKEIIPEAEAPMRGFQLAGGKVFVSYLDNVQSRIKVFDAEGKPSGEVAMPTIGSASGISGEWDRDEAFYSFTSFHFPGAIYRLNTATLKSSVWWKPALPVDTEEFEVKQVWYASKDGTRIPMFLLHKKGIKLDGTNPLLLTGYGGFRLTSTPVFSSTAAIWAEHGGVYALANLRGGGEFGENWHQAGMLEKKQNVFEDFIGAAEWLIASKYTKPSKIAIMGTSNGGLLVGAALTQRPDLYQAVICGYPLLDMLRYQKFLVARFWVPEYGSSEDAKQFEYIRRYSPYQNVKKGGKYPSIMIVTGDSDTRVDPLHGRKMAALLQASTGSGKPVLLHYDTKAGHSGGMTVTKSIELYTDELSYLFWQLGVN